MFTDKFGTTISYFVSGGTSVTGATRMAAEAQLAVEPHYVLGFSISEIALLVGIMGTCATVIFQYLNYRNNLRKNSDKD